MNLQEIKRTATVKNAVIKKARISTEHGLTAWLELDYGGTGQGFGGYVLYSPKGLEDAGSSGNYAGHFIRRVLDVAGVDEWSKLPGQNVRAQSTHASVIAIGHIIKDEWFCPKREFAMMEEMAGRTEEK